MRASGRGIRNRSKLLVALWAVALVLAGSGFARTAPITLRMFPAPGTSTASPETQISFRGTADVGEITVLGNLSGPHSGRFVVHGDRRGVSFLPDTPFHAGETVVVQSPHEIADAHAGLAQFGIAIPFDIGFTGGATVVDGGDWRSYWTMSGVRAPHIDVDTSATDLSSGVFFLTLARGPSGGGPYIVDATGKLIWFKPLPDGVSATDFSAQTYRGRPVMTWWEGTIGVGHGRGDYVVADASYQELLRIRAANGYHADLHDVVLNEDRTAWLIIYDPILWSADGRTGGRPVIDGVIQKIDLATGMVLFEWHALDHIGVEESMLTTPMLAALTVASGHDYVHFNAIDVLPNGNLLLSARHTQAIYQVDTVTGKVVWRLGGVRSDFEMGPDAEFWFQHDARWMGNGIVSIFDNGAGIRAAREVSRGVHLRLDEKAMTATLVQEFPHPNDDLSWSQGNMQTLPNGSKVIGWGSNRAFSQYAADGTLQFHGRMSPTNSYRVYRFPWRGNPTQPPRSVFHRFGRTVKAYVSWNGDTNVTRWQLLAGISPRLLRIAGQSTRTGFETSIHARTSARYFAVRGLDARGRVIVTTPARAA